MFPRSEWTQRLTFLILVAVGLSGITCTSLAQSEPVVVTTSTIPLLPNGSRGWTSPDGDLDWTVPDHSIRVSVSPDRTLVALAVRMVPEVFFEVGKRDIDAVRILVLRPTDPNSRYSLCLGCYKGFDVQWSPDSKYLAISKGYLTHNGDLDIYRVEHRENAPVCLDLLFRGEALLLPEGESWVNWEFKRWDLEKSRAIVEESDENPRTRKVSTKEISLLSKPIARVSLGVEPTSVAAGLEPMRGDH